ncbi:MAG: hypothetical protein IBJ03_10600 [Gemmatimonadaceae bacterium]|nr:hypothetical protein [Gemmatimonadaceae bacterium]
MAMTLLALTACGESSAEPEPTGDLTRDESAHFQTDSMQYSMTRSSQEYEAYVEMTYTNRRSDTVFVANCGGATAVVLERRVSGQWRTAWAPAQFPCLSQPIIVAPGATRRFSVRVGAGIAGGPVEPKWPFTDVDGEYRVVWGQFLSSYSEGRSPLGSTIPSDQRISNRFRIALRANP